MTADTINTVIEHVFTAATYTSVIANLIANSPFNISQFDDLQQDLIYYLLEQPEKTLKLFNKGELRYFWIAICRRQIQSTKSKLYGRYILRQKDEFEIFEETDQLNEQEEIDTHHNQAYCPDLEGEIDTADRVQHLNNIIDQHIDTSADCKRNLSIYRLYYFEDLTIKQISQRLKIPESSVFEYLKAAREFMRTQIDFALFTGYGNNNATT